MTSNTLHTKKRQHWQITLLGLLLLSLVFVLSIPYFVKRIPQQLEQSIQTRLQQHNIQWAVVEATGRNITLKGNAPTVEAHDQALHIAQQTSGVRELTNRMTPRIINPYTMSLAWNGKKLIIKGFIDSKANYRALLNHAFERYGKNNVTEKLTIGGGQPEHWKNMATSILTQLHKLEKGTIEITNQSIYIAGITPSSVTRQALIKTIKGFEQHQYALESHIVALDETDKICQEKFNTLLQQQHILFSAGNAIINPKSYPLLDKLADIAALCPKAKIIAAGYTDNQGNNEHNIKLSQARAKATVSQLFQRGIPLQRMTAIGYGKKSPIATNNTEQGRARNRRIELIVKGN